ncbi:unnamed protein product, partial [Polarella glacialis]
EGSEPAEPVGEAATEPEAASSSVAEAAAESGSAQQPETSEPVNDGKVNEESCFLVSWRDGQASSWVSPQLCWRMTADEDVMLATAYLFLELARGDCCDPDNLSKSLKKGADLMAVNGEGCTALLLAVRARVPVEAVRVLLEAGACPDAAGREGVTALELALRFQCEGGGDEEEHLGQLVELLKKHEAILMDSKAQHEESLKKLREVFGMKMVGALLTLQLPASLPVEVLDVLRLLFRELPQALLLEALEPQAFRALTALLQHLVGGTDNMSVALVGCRLMRALYSQSDPRLRYLVQSHGAKRWAERLATAKDPAQCGLCRQLSNTEKVTMEELSREAQALSDELGTGLEVEPMEQSEEWRSNKPLLEVVQALQGASEEVPGRMAPAEGLFALRELLKTTEKGSISDERCSAYELEKADVCGQLVQFMKYQAPESPGDSRRSAPLVNPDRWGVFIEAFGEASKQSQKGIGRLMKALHAVIETGEAMPVWRHKKERGLKALTEPLPLKLRHLQSVGDKLNVSVMIEPLAKLTELSRFLMKVTPCTDAGYLSYCHRLIGSTIRDQMSNKLLLVESFEILAAGLPLPVHRVRPAEGGDSQRVLLAARSFVIKGPLQLASDVEHLRLKVALNQLQ